MRLLSYLLGDDLAEKTGMSSRSLSLVDANTSLLCQLHSHQQKQRLQNQQHDVHYPLEHLRSDNDKTKLFDDQYSKNTKLSPAEIAVSCTYIILPSKISNILFDFGFMTDPPCGGHR